MDVSSAVAPMLSGAMSGSSAGPYGAAGGAALGLLSSFGKSSPGGTGTGGTAMNQYQSQTATQTQLNEQTVNIGSSVGGGDPAGLGGLDYTSLMPGFNGLVPSTASAVTVAPTGGLNWNYILIGGGILVAVWFFTQRGGTKVRYIRRSAPRKK